MSEQLFFVMVTISGGLRYLGVLGEDEISGWEDDRVQGFNLRNPKIYVELHQPPNPPRIMVVPMHLADTPQKEIRLKPEGLERLGRIKEEGAAAYCEGAQELYLVYKDAVTQWEAHRRGVKAPTAQDIANVNKGRGKGGPVLLK